MRSKAKVRVTRGGWQQWTEDDARQALAELAATGETLAAFSRRTGVSLARLAYWRRRVSLPETTTTDFVAVDVAGVGGRQLELVAAGIVVRVREDLDVDQVARLVEAIGRRVSHRC